MAKITAENIEKMEAFLGKLDTLEYGRVLDVAGGDARVAAAPFCNRFDAIDLFDQCPVALEKVN